MVMNTSFDAYPDRKRKGCGLRSISLVLVVLLIAVAVVAFLRRGDDATLEFRTDLPAVGQKTPVHVTAAGTSRGLTGVRVEAVQGDQRLVLAETSLEAEPWWAVWATATTGTSVTFEIGREAWPALQPGEVTLRAEATTAGSPLGGPKTSTAELTMPVRLVPPSIESLAEGDVVRQGGAGVVAYLVGESSVRVGVRVGELFFPGSPLTDLMPQADPRARFAFFAVPHDVDEPSEVRLTAVDELGNSVERPFLQRFDRRTFKADDIRVTDGFLEDVVPEILSQTPSLRSTGIQVDDYVTINRDLRSQNRARLQEIGASSRGEMLWSGAFLQLPNSSVMAGFGEDRTYLYDGRVIDRQTHLGYDLASVRRAEIPAAADGVVLLAEFFGIYGNTVVLDHGYGVLTLYSHLSQIDVTVGETLSRGDTLGRTGTTGLAGGDHLHFAVLVRGIQVDPLEWLDPKWIETRIASKLEAAAR